LKGKKPSQGAETAEADSHGTDKAADPAAKEGDHAGEKTADEHKGATDPKAEDTTHAKDGDHAAADPKAGTKDAPGTTAPATNPEATLGFGATYTFKPFHLNLGNPLENRYVRIEVAAEYKGGDPQKVELEARLPQLRDAVISVVQGKSREFILSPTGKDRLRYEITTQINQLMTKKIENVYITDLIIE
jgi:flagellar basal body-associated protein FliL